MASLQHDFAGLQVELPDIIVIYYKTKLEFMSVACHKCKS